MFIARTKRKSDVLEEKHEEENNVIEEQPEIPNKKAKNYGFKKQKISDLAEREAQLTSELFGGEDKIIEELGIEDQQYEETIEKEPEEELKPVWVDEYTEETEIESDKHGIIPGREYEEQLRKKYVFFSKCIFWLTS